MIVGKAIYNILSNVTAVTDIVSTKIYPEIAPQNESQPYIVYSVVSNSPTDTKEENGNVDEASIEVYCFNTKYSTAIDLGVAVRAALERKNGTFGGVKIQSINYINEQMDVNPERSIWVAIQDYTIRINNT
tara:strand:+ start:4918 stop:5310 length:393 start_codon:yes stop_codon:yes gene_type:complete